VVHLRFSPSKLNRTAIYHPDGGAAIRKDLFSLRYGARCLIKALTARPTCGIEHCHRI
jgi:hypothetical protein